MTGMGSILWILVIGFLLFSMLRKGSSGGCCGTGHAGAPGKPKAGKRFDPICGMVVDPAENLQTSTYKGKTVYFCSGHCKEEFDEDPEAYEEVIMKNTPAPRGCCG